MKRADSVILNLKKNFYSIDRGSEDFKQEMRAMILAAGYGTRLWPLTIDRAKPALPFMGRPLVGYVAEYLAGFGCREVLVNLHHRPESVRAALGDGSAFGVKLHYIEEPVILGTSGALDNARHFLETETFVVINGKLATDIDLHAALRTHRETGALATLVLRPNPARERYSTVLTRGGMLQGFGAHPSPLTSDNVGGAPRTAQNNEPHRAQQHETKRREMEQQAAEGREPEQHETKQQGTEQQGTEQQRGDGVGRGVGGGDDDVPLMFTGIQILEPRIFEYIPRGVFSHSTTEVYPQAIARGERIAVHVSDGMWHELSTIQRYLDTSILLMRGEGREVVAGIGSVVEDGATVSDSVLWENARVERGAHVRRAVLGAGVRVGRGERIENAAVVRAELLRDAERPPKALAGEVRGDNFVAPLPE